jgi:hypothetical protein
MNRIVVFLMVFFFLKDPSVLYASHIVGGDMTYRFIERQGENNLYRITLNVYYDCFPATNAGLLVSDSILTVAIYLNV